MFSSILGGQSLLGLIFGDVKVLSGEHASGDPQNLNFDMK